MLIHKRFGVYCFFATGGAELPGAEGGVPRCRTPCSSVSSPLLPGAGKTPRSKGVWNGVLKSAAISPPAPPRSDGNAFPPLLSPLGR